MKDMAPKNRTLQCNSTDIKRLSGQILSIEKSVGEDELEGRVICGNTLNVLPHLPTDFVDLLILDPPYNLSKNYNGNQFKEKGKREYQKWFQSVLEAVKPTLKPNATVYVCADWKTSVLIAPLLESHLRIRNRITWEREKGRGAKTNWKNNTEDIWFCTASDSYYFNVDAVKLKRKVIAPYTVDGKPKDWQPEEQGNYRLTHPSNIWTDITVPFWSMPENTDHPTQKPEKLIAKLVLASSRENDFILDPFLGSGTTAVVARKLGRRFCGIELNREYCCWALKRLERAADDPIIQGYTGGVFWERNSLSAQPKSVESRIQQKELFV